ncbi:MAG: FtsH protease activity modulator HflK [Arenicellales bacterium]
MPWNQPGSGGDDRDPWGQNDGQNGNGRKGGGGRDGPPDIDEVLRDAKKRIDSLFGGRRGGGSGGGGSGRERRGDGPSSTAIGLLVVIGLGVWIFSGFYTVDQGEQAIELRFGAFAETKDAGLRWHWPTPIESVEKINTQNVNTVEVGYRDTGRGIQTVPREALMLTQDENIIDVRFAVQYDIKEPTDLLFHVSEYDPQDIAESVVRGATESAVREVVGRNSMDFAITEGRAQLAAETKTLVQEILDRYDTGINIRSVEMQNAQPPEQVKDAFDDVVKAREDEVRLKSLAQAYENDIIPRTRGFAARILQEAEAYKASVTARAEGESERFNKVLTEYSKAPEITRDRLYLETMEEVLSRSSKIVIDQQGGNSLMYLPLDQLINRRGDSLSAGTESELSGSSNNSVANRSSSGALRSSSRTVDRSGRN